MTDGMAHVAGVDVSAGHWIGGKRVHSNETFEDRSPVDGQWLADVAAGGADHVDAAVAEARRTFPAWAALRPKGRLPILKKLADGIRAQKRSLWWKRSTRLAARRQPHAHGAACGAQHRVFHASVIDLYPEYRGHRPEGFFGHYLMTVGALGGRGCRARGTSMSSYENAIGTGQVHVWFDLAAAA